MGYGYTPVSLMLDQPTLKVVFDGIEYTCDRKSGGGEYGYGATPSGTTPDFSEYPFFLMTQEDEGEIYLIAYTQTVGTHSLKLSASEESVEVSDCFRKAVKQFSRYLVKFATNAGSLVDVMMVDSGTVLTPAVLPTPPNGTHWLNLPAGPITSDITIKSSNPIG